MLERDRLTHTEKASIQFHSLLGKGWARIKSGKKKKNTFIVFPGVIETEEFQSSFTAFPGTLAGS